MVSTFSFLGLPIALFIQRVLVVRVTPSALTEAINAQSHPNQHHKPYHHQYHNRPLILVWSARKPIETDLHQISLILAIRHKGFKIRERLKCEHYILIELNIHQVALRLSSKLFALRQQLEEESACIGRRLSSFHLKTPRISRNTNSRAG